MGRDWQQLMLLTPASPSLSPCQIKKPTTVAWHRSDCCVQRQAAESDKWSLYSALLRDNEEWQTLLTPAFPPISPFQMKKKPTTVAQSRSDCSVRRQAAKSVKSLKKTFYNALVRYNEEWPPLPAPSPFRPEHQGKKPVQRDMAQKECTRVRKRQQERNRKRRRHKEQTREWISGSLN